MEVAQASQTTGNGSPGQGAGMKSIEQLMAENEALQKEKASLQGSVQGLSRKNQEYEERIKTYEASGHTPSGETGDGELWVSPSEAARIADERYTARREQERKEEEASRREAVAFDTERVRWLRQAEIDIPESVNHESPVYKKALEVFADPTQGLSRNGQPLYPNAEYTAFSRAKILVSSQAATTGETRAGATFAATGGPSGAPATSQTGKLSDEEFLKLSPEQQEKYQQEQFNGKFGG